MKRKPRKKSLRTDNNFNPWIQFGPFDDEGKVEFVDGMNHLGRYEFRYAGLARNRWFISVRHADKLVAGAMAEADRVVQRGHEILRVYNKVPPRTEPGHFFPPPLTFTEYERFEITNDGSLGYTRDNDRRAIYGCINFPNFAGFEYANGSISDAPWRVINFRGGDFEHAKYVRFRK